MADPRGQLLAVLHDAASQQPEKLKGAQQHLKQWETSPDFYATLQVSWTLDIRTMFVGYETEF